MKIFKALKNDYFHLFVKRESRVVLGNKFSNLWLLTAVLTAAFLAVAFSNASLNYLSYKMDDPFINWVDIENVGNFSAFEVDLESEQNKERFHYYDYQSDRYFSFSFFRKNLDDIAMVKCRCFESLQTALVEAIIAEDNVVNGWCVEDLASVDEKSVGVIMTEELMHKLDYKSAPAYICYDQGGSAGAEDFGIDVMRGKFVAIPLPVLAVVKRLPGGVDMVASSYLYNQMNNDEHPFDVRRDDYAQYLRYFVPADISISEFQAKVNTIAEKYTSVELEVDDKSFYAPSLTSFRSGKLVVLRYYDEAVDYQTLGNINRAILAEYANADVHRLYDYEFSNYTTSYASFISVHFKDLDKLAEFEKYANDNFEIKIEMSQINAKQNFNAVSMMGNILSWVIIIFAIICIVLFIVNLLQSYFQKVKHNLGTFKAFGISNQDLILVYVLILAAIILSAVIISVSVTWLIQGGLHVCGILKDGMFDYLSLWSMKTIYSIVIIIFVSIFTVAAVMRKLLKATPGDLIYDRQ